MENINKRPLLAQPPIDRDTLFKFGILVGGVFLVIALWPLLYSRPVRSVFLAIALTFIFVGILFPSSLREVYRQWMRVGHVLGTLNTKAIFALAFFAVFTPIALIKRLTGKSLPKSFNKKSTSYFEHSDRSISMKNQF